MALALMVMQSSAWTLTLSDAARAYARRTEVSGATSIDLQNTPQLALGAAWPTTQLRVGYAPRFSWVDVLGTEPSPTLVLHSGELRLSWQWPRVALSLSQTVAVGDQDFSQVGVATSTGDLMTLPAAGVVPPTDPAPGDVMMPTELELLPAADVVAVAAEETSASLRYDWSRRWRSEVVAAFGFSGGADAEAQLFLPRQRTAQLDTALIFRRSRLDELSTGVTIARIDTSNGYDHWLASLIESWSMRWTRSSGGELGAGVSIQDTTGPAGLRATAWVPVGSASAWYALLMHAMEVRFQWNVGYRPDINVLAGTLQRRLFTSAQAGLTVEGSSLRLELGAAQTFPRDAPDATEVLSADLIFQQELVEWLFLQLGGQITRQRFGNGSALASVGSRWLLYAGLEARLPEVRF
jgi:hypothetical protein